MSDYNVSKREDEAMDFLSACAGQLDGMDEKIAFYDTLASVAAQRRDELEAGGE
jgi:hypothetical protein